MGLLNSFRIKGISILTESISILIETNLWSTFEGHFLVLREDDKFTKINQNMEELDNSKWLNNSGHTTCRTLLFYMRSVQKVSRILNFCGLHVFDFRFFVALCWYSYPSLMPTSSVVLNVRLIFNSYFAWTCFVLCSIFCYFKKWIKEFVSNFRGGKVNKEYYLQVMRNFAKQSARNARICGRTKIGFCTMITPLLTHRCLCANFWPKTQ